MNYSHAICVCNEHRNGERSDGGLRCGRCYWSAAALEFGAAHSEFRAARESLADASRTGASRFRHPEGLAFALRVRQVAQELYASHNFLFCSIYQCLTVPNIFVNSERQV